MIAVERVASCDPALVEAVARLLPQLSPDRAPPDLAALEALIADPQATLLAARSDGAVVGMATIAVYRKLTHVTARLEDVVVDEAARGRGVGAALVTAAIEEARRLGGRELELTTGPWREAANRLYPRLGFRRRETSVYLREL